MDIQRDLGRIEATQEIMKEDVKQIKADLAEIKDSISNAKAVKAYSGKQLVAVGAGVTFLGQLINYLKPYIHLG